MIEGINLLISIFIGCIVFIYYTNALFKPRTKYLYANISIIVGYMMLYAISSFYQPTLNVIAFSIATFVLMYLCFKVTLKNAIIQAYANCNYDACRRGFVYVYRYRYLS